MVAVAITDILNQWNQIGVFSYVIPFLLMFAVTFAILQKSKVFESDNDKNKGLLAIISISVSMLALQFDIVPFFFATIFPRFGVGLSVFLVIIIFMGLFSPLQTDKKYFGWTGIIVGGSVIIWSLISWNDWVYYGGFSWWISQYLWSIVILGGIIFVIRAAIK